MISDSSPRLKWVHTCVVVVSAAFFALPLWACISAFSSIRVGFHGICFLHVTRKADKVRTSNLEYTTFPCRKEHSML